MFGQINFGVNIGAGANNSIIISNHEPFRDISFYAFSYQFGVFANTALFKKLSVNTGVNYFRKRNRFTFLNSADGHNYIVAPLTLEYNIFKKINICAGMTNNFFVGNADKQLKKFYTYGFISGISYPINDKISLKFEFQRELTYHNILLIDSETTNHDYYQSFMLNLYIKLW